MTKMKTIHFQFNDKEKKDIPSKTTNSKKYQTSIFSRLLYSMDTWTGPFMYCVIFLLWLHNVFWNYSNILWGVCVLLKYLQYCKCLIWPGSKGRSDRAVIMMGCPITLTPMQHSTLPIHMPKWEALQAAGRTGVRGATCIITERDNLSYQGGDSTFIAYGVAFCVS